MWEGYYVGNNRRIKNNIQLIDIPMGDNIRKLPDFKDKLTYRETNIRDFLKLTVF